MSSPLEAISLQSSSIWKREGVMSPLAPMMAALFLIASSIMVSLSTITPRSNTLNPLQESTMPVMFLPMSCTSPLTVALIITGLSATSPSSSFIYGSSTATASFMILADFTTCGRNILPSPKSWPTFSIPAIRAPSMTLTGLPAFSRQASTSSSSPSVRPFTRASASLSSAVA